MHLLAHYIIIHTCFFVLTLHPVSFEHFPTLSFTALFANLADVLVTQLEVVSVMHLGPFFLPGSLTLVVFFLAFCLGNVEMVGGK